MTDLKYEQYTSQLAVLILATSQLIVHVRNKLKIKVYLRWCDTQTYKSHKTGGTFMIK